MSLFEDIKTGLEEAIAYKEGRLHARTVTMSVAPIDCYDAKEIRDIRISTGMTQIMFAKFMGVSEKTVEAWESGKNKPAGPACRLLALTKMDPSFPKQSGIVVQ